MGDDGVVGDPGEVGMPGFAGLQVSLIYIAKSLCSECHMLYRQNVWLT